MTGAPRTVGRSSIPSAPILDGDVNLAQHLPHKRSSARGSARHLCAAGDPHVFRVSARAVAGNVRSEAVTAPPIQKAKRQSASVDLQ